MLLAACANQVAIHQPLPSAVRNAVASTDVVLPIRQSEIYVFVPHSTGGQANGLIGAIIDASVDDIRTSKAEAAVTPLRNSIVDYNFDNTLQADLKRSLAQLDWMHAANYSVVRDAGNDNLGKMLAASHASAMLFVVADYHLSNDGDVLLVGIEAALIANTDQLRALRPAKRDDKVAVALSNALYRNRFIFEAHVNATGDRDKNIAEWSANNGNAIRAALDMSTKKLAPLLAADLQRAEGDVAPPENAPQTAVSVPSEASDCMLRISGAQCANSGTVIGQDEDGQILRFKDGSLKYAKVGNF